jgi:hypothetical protein
MEIELLNRALRPSSIAALIVVAVLFLASLGAIMLFRYAVHGEIDWQGLAAFCSLVLVPWLQHAQNRHVEKRAGVTDRPLAPAPSGSERSHTGGLVNNEAIA